MESNIADIAAELGCSSVEQRFRGLEDDRRAGWPEGRVEWSKGWGGLRLRRVRGSVPAARRAAAVALLQPAPAQAAAPRALLRALLSHIRWSASAPRAACRRQALNTLFYDNTTAQASDWRWWQGAAGRAGQASPASCQLGSTGSRNPHHTAGCCLTLPVARPDLHACRHRGLPGGRAAGGGGGGRRQGWVGAMGCTHVQRRLRSATLSSLQRDIRPCCMFG